MLDFHRAPSMSLVLKKTKWNFDVEMDSGISGPPVTSRPDEGLQTATAPTEIPTVPPPAPPPEEHIPEMRGQGAHSGAELSVRNRQKSWMPGMRDSRSGEVTHS